MELEMDTLPTNKHNMILNSNNIPKETPKSPLKSLKKCKNNTVPCSLSLSPKTVRIIYLTLLCLRIYCAYLPGYIHPDEFFQSGQELFFGISSNNVQERDGDRCSLKGNSSFPYGTMFPPTTMPASSLPWEFQSKNAIRSIVPPFFMTLLPLNIYTLMCQFSKFLMKVNPIRPRKTKRKDECSCHEYSGPQILIIPRIFLAICSIFAIDLPIWYILRVKNIIHESVAMHPLDDIQLTKSMSHQLASLLSFREKEKPFPPELLLLASSWPILLFSSRPFTNTLESMILALLMALVTMDIAHFKYKLHYPYTIQTSIGVGILCAMGIFTRFTFIFFAFPILVLFVYHRGIRRVSITKDNPSETKIKLRSFFTQNTFNFGQLFHSIIWMLTSFVLISVLIAYIDGQFYFQQQMLEYMTDPTSFPTRKFMIFSPINALLYNSKLSNLSEHGIHPRITHALVNMPMLFGPFSIFFYHFLATKCRKQLSMMLAFVYSYKSNDERSEISKDDSSSAQQKGNDMVDKEHYNHVNTICYHVIICGLFILSCAPHQEPRFLLPLSVPLVVLYGSSVFHTKREIKVGTGLAEADEKRSYHDMLSINCAWLVGWILFNLLLLLFFGVLHQSGVIPSLIELSKPEPFGHFANHSPPKAIIFYHTYMPPTFLSRSCNTYREENLMKVEGEQCSPSLTQSNSIGLSDYASIENTWMKKVLRNWRIEDLKGSELRLLQLHLQNILKCDYHQKSDEADVTNTLSFTKEPFVKESVVVIAPKVAMGINQVILQEDERKFDSSNEYTKLHICNNFGKQYKCQKFWAYKWHVSTEDMPTINVDWVSNSQLDAIEVLCT